MPGFSTWWAEGRRLHIRSSRLGIGLIRPDLVVTIAAVDRLIAGDDALTGVGERLLKGREDDAAGLQYFLLGKLVRVERTHARVKLEGDVLEVLDRALVEHVDLSVRYVTVRTHQHIDGGLDLLAELLDQEGGKLVQFPSGGVLIHRVISRERRLLIRERADARAKFVDSALAQLRRAPTKPEAA